MAFVVDASVTATWLLPDESSAVAQAAYARLPYEEALVPHLWWFEMRNIFLSAERRGRLDAVSSNRALALLAGLPIQLDSTADSASVMELGRKHKLTSYDAAYLELALRETLPLATLDRALARAAQAEGVVLIEGD
ncbi:MAG: type II toxin-antitoxin system VapC family toxin [Pigmentiphaga sp.]